MQWALRSSRPFRRLACTRHRMTSKMLSSLHTRGRSVLLVEAMHLGTDTLPKSQPWCDVQLLYSDAQRHPLRVKVMNCHSLRTMASGEMLAPRANRATCVTIFVHRSLFSLGSSFGFWWTENWCSYETEDGLRNVNLDIISSVQQTNALAAVPDNICCDLRNEHLLKHPFKNVARQTSSPEGLILP